MARHRKYGKSSTSQAHMPSNRAMASPTTSSGSVIQWLSPVKRKRRRSPQDQPRNPIASRLVPHSGPTPVGSANIVDLVAHVSSPVPLNANADATSKPPLADATPSRSPSDAASIASSESSESTVSRRSSPPKQLRAMELSDDGFTHRKFTDSQGELPATLVVLIRKLRRIGRGPEIEASSYADDILDDAFSSSNAGYEPQRALPWRTAVLTIQRANKCEVLGEEEAV
ncbi:hypothetical protein QQX98_000316 [Neonectria punicea]|uniref:Uncharacterized protein n=1 Tax=Neonectria punicea TaxID=979145 RepID=A0ABR1HU18_9HYPO